ncbi:MAG: hypothetical protein ACLR23_03245 [Clostridia bacterium]
MPGWGDSLGGIGSAASDYYKGIETAGNILDDFNTSLIVSSEKQQELAAQMEEVQGQITEIARTASERRRDLTEEEIQKLEELFEQMRNLAKGELEIQQQYQQTVMDQAEMFVQTFDGSLEKFREGSQKFINSAAETRQEVVDKAQRQYEEETTLIRTAMDAKNTLYSEAFMAERSSCNPIWKPAERCIRSPIWQSWRSCESGMKRRGPWTVSRIKWNMTL